MAAKKNAVKKDWPEANRPARYGRFKHEEVDMTPIEMPLGACRPTPLQDLIAHMVRQQVQQESGDEWETPDEADDFEEEEPDTLDMSPYEQIMIEPEDLPTAELEAAPASHEVPGSGDPAENQPPELVEAARRILAAAEQTGDAPDLNEPEPS